MSVPVDALALLSHATPELSARRRRIIRWLEALFGGRRLAGRIGAFRARHVDPGRFWSDVVAALGLEIRAHVREGTGVRATGPSLFVANHPFGIADGAAVAALLEARRHDLKVVVWDVFARAPETRGHLLGLDLADDSRAARRQNLATRREAVAHLHAGGAVLLFPSGNIERSVRPFGPPEEGPWHRFVARLALGSGASVQPMFVAGHNGRLFHAASHLGPTLRRSLCLRELRRRLDSTVDIAVGAPVSSIDLAALGDDDAIAAHLRERTLALGRGVPTGAARSPADAVLGARRPLRGRFGRRPRHTRVTAGVQVRETQLRHRFETLDR